MLLVFSERHAVQGFEMASHPVRVHQERYVCGWPEGPNGQPVDLRERNKGDYLGMSV